MSTRRYPVRVRKPVKRWEPSTGNEKDLGDDDWGSDVEMAESEEEDVVSDDSLYQFMVEEDEEDDPVSVAEESADDDYSLTEESSDSEWERQEDEEPPDTPERRPEEEDAFDLPASADATDVTAMSNNLIGGTYQVPPTPPPTPEPLNRDTPAQLPQDTQDGLNVPGQPAGDIP